MSIILKGIDMPKKGKTIRLEIEDDGTIWQEGYDIKGRLQDAQAIQIPTPHGRLIDASELKESIEEVDRPSGYTALVHIQYAPTILEAEETNGD